MGSWLVHNDADRKTLSRIAQSLRNRHSGLKYVVSKFLDAKYPDARVGQRRAGQEYTRVEQLVRITDNNVYNALIDTTAMESVILASDDAQALGYYSGSVGSKRFPRNVSKCITRDGDQYSCRGGSEVKIADFNRNKVAKFFHMNAGAEITRLEEELQRFEQEHHVHDKNLEEHKRKIQEMKKEKGALRAEQTRSQQRRNELKDELDDLRERQRDMEAKDEDDALAAGIGDMENHLEQIGNEISEYQEKVDDLNQDLEKTKGGVAPAETAYEKAKRDADVLEASLDKIQAEQDAFFGNYDKVTSQAHKRRERVKDKQDALKGLQEILAEKKEKWEASESGALEFCEGVRREPRQNKAQIDKKIASVERAIEKEKKRLAQSGTDIRELLKSAQVKAKRAKRNYSTLKENVIKISKRLNC